MESYFQPNSPDAAYIMAEMNRYADEQQSRWQRRVEGIGNDCGICLEPLPRHPWLGDQGKVLMLCCGNAICTECNAKRGEHLAKMEAKLSKPRPTRAELLELDKATKQMNCCIMCREPLPKGGSGNTYQGVVTAGHGGAADLKKYREWAKKGKGWANYDIAKRYDEGVNGCPLDKAKALHHFKLASEQGHDKAMTDLAVMYIQGDGCDQDLPMAKEWLEAAAKLDNAKAQCYLGYFLSDARHEVPLDFPEARRLFLRSAELGFPPAQEKLGLGYSKGEFGFTVDLSRAIHWYTQASEQGEVSSMMALAMVLMEEGEGKHGALNVAGESPMPKAINWMRRAGKLGDETAKKRAHVTDLHIMKQHCANCREPPVDKGGSANLKVCAKCKVVYYCGSVCQKTHWHAGHKKDCCKYMG